MMWPDELASEIQAYAESLGIRGTEVDISNHWRAGEGVVMIQTGPECGDFWASMDYRLPRSGSLEESRPVIIKAGREAVDHLLQHLSTKH